VAKFAINTVGNALGSVYFVGDLFNTIVNKIERGVFGSWSYGESIASSFLDTAINVIAYTYRAIEESISNKKYKAGEKKGEEKWKTTAKKAVESAIDSIGAIKGIPIRTARKDLEALYKRLYKKPDSIEKTRKEIDKTPAIIIPKRKKSIFEKSKKRSKKKLIIY